MRRMRKITTFLLALMMILAMTQLTWAIEGGTYTYTGGRIKTSNASSIQDAIAGLEPGDSFTINQTYINDSDVDTNWYIENQVLKTLEEQSEAKGANGGYTYILTVGGTEVFNSDTVGGSNGPDSKEGLKQATDATSEWFYIGTLKPGESGETTLYVALDGESQANVYELTSGELEIRYAVEEVDDTVTYEHIPGKVVRTGDDTNILGPVLMLVGAAVLFILVAFSFRKDRKDGEDA